MNCTYLNVKQSAELITSQSDKIQKLATLEQNAAADAKKIEREKQESIAKFLEEKKQKAIEQEALARKLEAEACRPLPFLLQLRRALWVEAGVRAQPFDTALLQQTAEVDVWA